MTSILYCENCTLPPEYCRYSNSYDQCLKWLKKSNPNLYETEINDLKERNPKIFKKIQKKLNNDNEQQEEQKSNKNKNKKKNQQKKNKANMNNDNDDNVDDSQLKETKQVRFLEKKIKKEQAITNKQMKDLEAKMAKFGVDQNSPTKSILKNKQNPNMAQEQQQLKNKKNDLDYSEGDDDDELLKRNINRSIEVKGRKHKQKGRKRNRRKKRGGRQNNNDNDDEEQQQQQHQPPPQQQPQEQLPEPVEIEKEKKVKFNKRDKKNKNKKIIEVIIENRKGNKKVTCVRGLLELNMKEKDAKKAFRQKFATGVGCNFVNGDSGPKEFVLQGDVRYDLMKFMRSKYGVPAKMLFYKKKGKQLYPACNDQGMALPPPF